MSEDSRRKQKPSTRFISHGETPASRGNAANLITVFRILLAPVMMALLLIDQGEMTWMRYLAAAIFILGMATDSVDGNLARKRNLVTDVGKILDPIADKVLTGGALICLSILGELWWWVTIIILLREFGITLHRLLVLHKRVIPAAGGGKLKTVIQTIAISFFLVPLNLWIGDWVLWVNWILMGLALLLTTVSGVQYLLALRREYPKAV